MINITKNDILQSFVEIVSAENISKISGGLDVINKIAIKLNTSPQYITLLFNNQAKDIINFYFENHNQSLIETINQNQTISDEKSLTNKIKAIFAKKIELLYCDKEFIKNISKYLAMPQNIILAIKINAQQSDNIWKASLHNPSDFSYYTKRLSLAVIYALVISKFIKNDSLENILQFSNTAIDGYVKFMSKVFK